MVPALALRLRAARILNVALAACLHIFVLAVPRAPAAVIAVRASASRPF